MRTLSVAFLYRIIPLHMLLLGLCTPADTNAQCCWEPLPIRGYFVTGFFPTADTGHIGGDAGIYKTTDGGNTWRLTTTDFVSAYSMGFETPARGVVVGFNGTYGVTSDGGDTWQRRSIGASTVHFMDVAVAADGLQVIVGDSSTILLSSDHGATWLKVPVTNKVRFSYCTMFDSMIACIGSIMEAPGGLLLYLSTDRGIHWVSRSLEKYVTDLRFLDRDTLLFCGSGFDAISLYSISSGVRTGILDNLGAGPLVAVEVSRQTGVITAVGDHGQVQRSWNRGRTWTWCHAGGGNTNTAVCQLENGPVYVVSIDTVFRACTATAAENPEIAKGFDLTCYPVPASGESTISFELPERSTASLVICDALGHELRTLLREELPAGTHLRNWSARGLAPGVYYCRLQAGALQKSSRIVVMRE